MKVIGVISLFEEPLEWVEESISRAASICDHMIVVDGAFESYPHKSPRSPDEMMEVAVRACGRTPVTTLVPGVAWPSQADKITACFALCEAFGTWWEDWLFVFAADEFLHCKPRKLREYLATTQADQICIPFLTLWPEKHTYAVKKRGAMTDDTRDVSRILRIHRDMYVEPPTHWRWTGTTRGGQRVALHGSGEPLRIPDAPSERLPRDMAEIVHHTLFRDQTTMRKKARYRQNRTRRQEDM